MGKGDQNKGVEIKLSSFVLFLPTGLEAYARPRSSIVFLTPLSLCIRIALPFPCFCFSSLSFLIPNYVI